MKKALLLSVESYNYSVTPLNGCHNDTEEWKKILTSMNFTTISKPDLVVSKAMGELKLFIKDLNDNNIESAVIVFSGHGFFHGLEEGLLFSDKEIYDHHLLQELYKLNDSTKLTVVLDCCYAAGITYSTHNILQLLGYDKEFIKSVPNDEIVLSLDVYEQIQEYNLTSIDTENYQLPNPIIIYDLKQHISSLGYPDSLTNDLPREKMLTPLFSYKEVINSHKNNVYNDTLSIKEAIDEVKKLSLGTIDDDNYFYPTSKSSQGLSPELLDVMKNRNDDEFKQIGLITSSKPNIVFLSAVAEKNQQAYERLFQDGNYYGVLSYYATKVISTNSDLTYNRLEELVNKQIEDNETNVKTKKQRISAFGVDENRLNRKLFT